MKNTIAESKTTDLIVQVTYKDDNIIKGQVLVGDEYNRFSAWRSCRTQMLIRIAKL